jgi:hypothetical protein
MPCRPETLRWARKLVHPARESFPGGSVTTGISGHGYIRRRKLEDNRLISQAFQVPSRENVDWFTLRSDNKLNHHTGSHNALAHSVSSMSILPKYSYAAPVQDSTCLSGQTSSPVEAESIKCTAIPSAKLLSQAHLVGHCLLRPWSCGVFDLAGPRGGKELLP